MSTVSSTPGINPYLVQYSSSDISGTDTTAGKYTASSSSKSGSSSSSGSYSQSIVGQMSGFDVGNMVNESMQSDVIKLNSLLSKQQVSQWQQDRYRSVITNLQDFSSKYFDVLSDDYILSSNSFSVNNATSTNANVVGATASNAARTGAYIVTSATLATAAKVTSDVLNKSGVKPAALDSISSIGVTTGKLSFLVDGKTINYSLNSNSTISSVMSDLSLASGLNFNYSELTGKFSVSTQKTGLNQKLDIENISDGCSFFSSLKINPSGGSAIISDTTATITGSAGAIKKTVGGNAAALDKISSTSLGSALTNGSTITFNISKDGGTTSTAYHYKIDTSKSINTLMSDLSSLTGSNFSYDASQGKVSAESIGTTKLSIDYNNDSNTQTFFNNIFAGATSTNNSIIQTSTATATAGSTAGADGQFTIKEPGDSNSTTVTKSSNNFTIDGVSYSFSSSFDSTKLPNPDPVVTINVNQDVTSAVNKIKDFVTDYNNLIDGINTVVTERRNYDYKPLSSAQESQMTASQITAWNQKAQQGLLGNDGTLSDMLGSFREAFYTPVDGNSLTMAGVGLSTSNDPTQGGKLTLDTKALKAALQNNPQQVANLFTQNSSKYPTYESALEEDTTTDSRAVSKAVSERNNAVGILRRLSDIEKKYAGTYVDKQGNQGILLMKAGMPNTVSETKSTLYKELKDEASAVSDFKTKIKSDEKMYTQKFSILQSILTQLSSQQSALSSMLGTSS